MVRFAALIIAASLLAPPVAAQQPAPGGQTARLFAQVCAEAWRDYTGAVAVAAAEGGDGGSVIAGGGRISMVNYVFEAQDVGGGHLSAHLWRRRFDEIEQGGCTLNLFAHGAGEAELAAAAAALKAAVAATVPEGAERIGGPAMALDRDWLAEGQAAEVHAWRAEIERGGLSFSVMTGRNMAIAAVGWSLTHEESQ